MDAGAIYHFLFETYTGIGILVAAGLVISLILCVIMERKTRSVYKDRGPKTDDEWSLFDDDDNEEEEETAPAKPKAKPAPAEEKKPEIKKATVRRAK